MGYGTDGLTFRTLRNGNLKRLPLFKDRHGNLSHPPEKCSKPGDNWDASDWVMATVGELGELANVLKKVLRGDFDPKSPEVRKMIADELADVAVYLDLLAFNVDVDLGEAVMSKWNETSRKLGIPLIIDAEDWHWTDPRYESLDPPKLK